MRALSVIRGIAFRAALRPALVMTGVGSVTSYGSQIHDLRGTLAQHEYRTYGTRPESDIKGAIFHHSATSGQSIRSISDFHVVSRGWPGVGYHFAIGYDGKVYLLNDPTTVSYHTSGYNYNNVAVVLIGNFHERPLTPEMEVSIVGVIQYLKDRYGVEYVWMHREVGQTHCPGKYAVAYLTPLLYGSRPK